MYKAFPPTRIARYKKHYDIIVAPLSNWESSMGNNPNFVFIPYRGVLIRKNSEYKTDLFTMYCSHSENELKFSNIRYNTNHKLFITDNYKEFFMELLILRLIQQATILRKNLKISSTEVMMVEKMIEHKFRISGAGRDGYTQYFGKLEIRTSDADRSTTDKNKHSQ